ncbi:MAG: glycosyltransferase family 39 protein [Rhodospirillales bacterium]|nr:glycosyltransferase family 39 protein [Rhodospirillales bacterium]MDE2577019.1 glycosyltransferase family 39 protein [Rhodospirillales bacterium]
MTPRRALAWLIAASTAVRLAMAWAIGLGIDESYMVAAGRHFHAGYFDHPPLSWWLAAGAAHVFGSDGAIIVRLPFILVFALSTWLMFRLTALLFDARAGFLAALAFNLSPVFGVTTGGWVLPDGPLICALLAAGLCLAHAVSAGGWRWWLGAGAAAGLALLSKYSAGLVLLGAFAALLTQPRHRRLLATPPPWIAAGLALLLFSPVVIWNARHGWASFAFQGGRADIGRLHPLAPLAIFGGEAAFLLPWIWLGLMVEFVAALRRGPGEWRGWLLAGLALVPVLLFAVVGLWSPHVLFHWAAPGYLFLFPLLGARLARWPVPLLRRVAGATAGLLVLGLVLVATEVRLNWLAVLAPGLDPGMQAVDWTPLGAALAARGLPGDAVLAGTGWSQTGKIDYALGGRFKVLCLNTDAREYALLTSPAESLGRDVLIITPREDSAALAAAYRPLFATVTPLAPAVLHFPFRGDIRFSLLLGHDLRRWPP